MWKREGCVLYLSCCRCARANDKWPLFAQWKSQLLLLLAAPGDATQWQRHFVSSQMTCVAGRLLPVPSWTLLSSYRSSFLRHIGIWRFVSSGVWRRFTRSFIPDVSKERSAFNFRGWGQHPSTIVTIVVFCFRLYGTWIANMAPCLGQANVLKGSDVCRTKRRNREPQDRQKPTELNWV